jgi:hypothetical protein
MSDRFCCKCGKRVYALDAPHKPRKEDGPVPNDSWYCSLGCKWADEEVKKE